MKPFDNFQSVKDKSPQARYLIMLALTGELTKIREPKKYYKASNLAGASVIVWNISTQKLSTKSVYFDKNGDFYIKARWGHQNPERVYLSEFKESEK